MAFPVGGGLPAPERWVCKLCFADSRDGALAESANTVGGVGLASRLRKALVQSDDSPRPGMCGAVWDPHTG